MDSLDAHVLFVGPAEQAARVEEELSLLGGVTVERLADCEGLASAAGACGCEVVIVWVGQDPSRVAEAFTSLGEAGVADRQIPLLAIGVEESSSLVGEVMRRGASDYFCQTSLRRLAFAVERELRGSRRRPGTSEGGIDEGGADVGPLAAWFEELPVGTSVLAEDRRFLRANAELCRILDRDEASLRRLRVEEVIEESDAAHLRRQCESLAAGAIGQVHLDQRFRRADGETVWARLAMRSLRDETGHQVRFLATVEDITERKRAEDILRRHEEQVRNSAKMEAIGRLAGGIAHDFNNQLTVVKGYCDILLSELSGGDPNRELIAEVSDAARRAAEITSQLLAFSRQQVLRPEEVDLGGVVRELANPLARMLGEDIELQVICEPDAPQVHVDPRQVQRALMNLAVNSREVMPEGGKLVLETACVRLDGKQLAGHPDVRPGRYVMLRVSDTGPGMDRGTLENVFEPFYSTKDDSSGMGLAMVYGFVKQSGGHIEVASAPGEGTTFRMYWPVATAASAEAPDVEPADVSSREGESVLVVEDDQAVRQIVSRCLRAVGYEVAEAASAEDALGEADRLGRLDLLITDVVLPGASGKELAARLVTSRPEAIVLYMTGYADHAETGDICPVLRKPFSPDELVRTVRTLLSEAQGRDDG